MADGSFKPIEQIQAGDKVFSRDESSGETAVKNVTQTFERQADATLILHFSSGERVETTPEHPFYVEGRGFVKAGELGIGTSIVTRAGPSLQVLAVQRKDAPATVYNFEVADFHTYFVGRDALWVHNSCESDAIASGHAFDKHILFKDEFAGLGIRTKQQFSDFIDNIIRTGEKRPALGPNANGRVAYWDNSTLTIVIHDPNSPDLGTCFRPDQNVWPGRTYFDTNFPI